MGEAVVIGSEKPYLTAIICIRFSIVSKLAEKLQLPFTSYTGLAAQKKFINLLKMKSKKLMNNFLITPKLQNFYCYLKS